MSDDHVIQAHGGTVTVTHGALSQVVISSAEAVDGARVRRPRRGLEIDLDGERVRVSLELAVRYGGVLPDVAREVQHRVAEGLRTMCGLDASSVDVAVEELDGP
jgi:uncharacterized alkaline shock family protein YloU